MIRDDLLRLEQAGKVEIHGTQDEQIFVEYDNARLSALGISPFQLQQILESRNVVMPGGSVKTSGGEILLRSVGQGYRGADFEDIVVLTRADGTRLLLGEVARVVDGFEEDDQYARFDGKPAVAVMI